MSTIPVTIIPICFKNLGFVFIIVGGGACDLDIILTLILSFFLTCELCHFSVLQFYSDALCAQLLLQFSIDLFETVHLFALIV